MIIFIILFSIGFIVSLKKFHYNFKGVELVIFWLLFTIFTYFDFGVEGLIDMGLVDIPIIFIALYYLIKVIKTKQYIGLLSFIVQIVSSIIFIIIFSQYENSICDGMCFGSLIFFIIFIAIIIYMLLVNLVMFIVTLIKNKKKISFTYKNINKKWIIISIIVVFIVLSLLVKGVIVTN
ncbi:MAG: hypothetical protein E7169_00720 [Firmicutes bacterium]|nr:hypothetical protein [Bacillota bacterium]